jgi:hypothetical protein
MTTRRDHGFVTDDAGQCLFFPTLGQPRLVPSAEEEARFRRALNGTFVCALILWAASAAALVYFRDWPLKSAAHGLIPVVLVRVACAVLSPRRWPLADQTTVRSTRSAPSIEAATSDPADRRRLVRKAVIYGVLTAILFAGGVACAIVLPNIWETLEESKRARDVQVLAVSFALSLFFGIHTLRLRHSLRRLAAAGGAVSRR